MFVKTYFFNEFTVFVAQNMAINREDLKKIFWTKHLT